MFFLLTCSLSGPLSLGETLVPLLIGGQPYASGLLMREKASEPSASASMVVELLCTLI